MKRGIFIAILIVGLSANYSFGQMGGNMMDGQTQQQTGVVTYGTGNYPCTEMMGSGGGFGMMGHMGGMMGYSGQMGGMMGSGGMMGYGGQMGGMMGTGYGGHMSGMMGSGMGSGMQGYNAESFQKYQDEYKRYLDDTVDLRRKLHNKKFEYSEAIRNGDTKRETLFKLEKDMIDIQWEIYTRAPR